MVGPAASLGAIGKVEEMVVVVMGIVVMTVMRGFAKAEEADMY